MRRIIYSIGLLIIIVLLVGGAYFWYSGRSQRALDAYHDQAAPLISEFLDVTLVAASTSRISLAPLVNDLQRIHRDFRQITPPISADSAHKQFSWGMELIIKGFLKFMAQEVAGDEIERGINAIRQGQLDLFGAQLKQ